MPRVVRKLVDYTALGPGGRALWDATLEDFPDLDARQKIQLLEACRMKDRLDKLDLVLRGDVATWVSIDFGDEELHLVVDKALAQANTTTNIMKQTIAAMRLPDANGKRAPAPRTAGAYVKGGKVSSLDRARQRGA